MQHLPETQVCVIAIYNCDPVVIHVNVNILGEGQVYTIGFIGKHRVVSTKLTRIGYGEGATTAAGNAVTRLLGEKLCREDLKMKAVLKSYDVYTHTHTHIYIYIYTYTPIYTYTHT